ncbi:MAG: hypothetical protein Q9187_008635, partial [Circinaria calcarea]
DRQDGKGKGGSESEHLRCKKIWMFSNVSSKPTAVSGEDVADLADKVGDVEDGARDGEGNEGAEVSGEKGDGFV